MTRPICHLRTYREAAGLTRRQLSNLAGVRVDRIRDAEMRIHTPSLETAVRLANALSIFGQPVSVDDLFEFERAAS